MRIFITGGKGFIGRNLVSKLLKLNHEVATFDKDFSFSKNPDYHKNSLRIREKYFKLKRNVQDIKGDIRDREHLRKAVEEFKPDVIVNLAGLPMARIAPEFRDDMTTINMQGAINVLDVFEDSQTAQKIIYTSSSMAYGHFTQVPQGEDSLLNPINTYGAAKAAGEYFTKLSKKEWVIIRPTSVYGFTDCANRVTQLLIDAAATGKPAWVVKGETLDFSYVDDVAEGFVKCITLPQAIYQTMNISRGEAVAASHYAELVKKHYPKFEYEVREPNAQQVWRGPLDITRAKNTLDFDPQYGIEKGLEETINLINEYGFYDFLKK